MLYCFSDGSVSCDGVLDNSVAGKGKGIWKSDSSSTASVFILVFHPDVQPQLTDPSMRQIGWFRPDGSVETAASRVSNNVPLLAETIVLNFMALNNDVGRFASVLPLHGLGTDLDSLIAFQPLPPVLPLP